MEKSICINTLRAFLGKRIDDLFEEGLSHIWHSLSDNASLEYRSSMMFGFSSQQSLIDFLKSADILGKPYSS